MKTCYLRLMQGLRSDEPDEEKANERIAACLKLAADAAHRLGTQIVIEPVNHQQVGFNNTANEVRAMVERVGYMLDTIHLCESNGGPFGRATSTSPPCCGP